MKTEKTWTKSELWAAMCQYDGEFTLAHAESVLKYFNCGECPGKVGDECDTCPIKKAETVRINHLWKMAAERREEGETNSIIEKREPLVIETGPSKDDGQKRRPFDVAPNSPSILAILNILQSGRK